MMSSARRDIEGEGFSADNAGYYLEFIGDDDLSEYNVRSEKTQLTSGDDVKELCTRFGRPGGQGAAKVAVSTVILNAVVPMPHYELTASPLSGEDPGGALKGQRDVFWSPETGYRKTPIYDRELLTPGNKVNGPAVVEAKDTTYIIPANKSYYIGEYSHGVLGEA
jgi:N-methylhydantoinase A/oxoprolinase/acetone carboxylase beta subunit